MQVWVPITHPTPRLLPVGETEPAGETDSQVGIRGLAVLMTFHVLAAPMHRLVMCVEEQDKAPDFLGAPPKPDLPPLGFRPPAGRGL